MYVYLHNFVDNLGGTVKDIFDDDEKGVFVERFISMDMSSVNEVTDFLVGQGEDAMLALNVFLHIGNDILDNAQHGDR